MRIPKKIKIGAHIYTVKFVDSQDIEGVGEQNRSRNIIRIANDLPQTQIEETLLHEILHACNAGLKEEVVDGLSISLYQVLKDNKLIK